jgi:hypothetical protein
MPSSPDSLQEKPQLHSDSLMIPRHELESERLPDVRSELPAREAVGEELLGDTGRSAALSSGDENF